MSLPRNQIIKWLSEIDITDKRVLDVGAGKKEQWACNFTQGKAKKYKTADVEKYDGIDVVLDLNERIMERTYNYILDGKFDEEAYERFNNSKGFLDYKNYKENYEFIRLDGPCDDELWRLKQFDIVFCIEVFEHLYDPVQAMCNVKNFLKKSGVVYITVPLVSPYHDSVDYLRYTREWFERIADELDFSSCEITSRVATEGKGLLDKLFQAEGMRMTKWRIKDGQRDRMDDLGYMVKLTK